MNNFALPFVGLAPLVAADTVATQGKWVLDPLLLADMIFLFPAAAGALLGAHYLARLGVRSPAKARTNGGSLRHPWRWLKETAGAAVRKGEPGSEAYTIVVLLVWALALIALLQLLGHAGQLELPGGQLKVPLVVPMFAYLGVVGYSTYSIVQNHGGFLDRPDDRVRRKLLVSIASRVTITPYLAVVLALLLGVKNGEATGVFLGLFTGLWIKVVISALNEAGTKLLPKRLQEELEDRLQKPAGAGAGASPVLALAKGNDPARVLKDAWQQVRALPNVVGVSLGVREKDGIRTSEPVVVVKVSAKGDVATVGLIPATLTVPNAEGKPLTLPTDVIEVGESKISRNSGAADQATAAAEAVAAHATATATSPGAAGPPPPGPRTVAPAAVTVAPGTRIANACSPDNRGTIACLVQDVATHERLLLSAYHVLKAPSHPPGGVKNPGADADLVAGSTTIAQLVRGARTAYVDAAVARPTSGVSCTAEVLELGVPGPADEVYYEDVDRRRVQLRGQYSEVVTALIRENGAIHRFAYPDGPVELYGLIGIDPVTAGGDSGALVMDMKRRVLGLLIGGDRTRSYAVPISAIQNALSVAQL